MLLFKFQYLLHSSWPLILKWTSWYAKQQMLHSSISNLDMIADNFQNHQQTVKILAANFRFIEEFNDSTLTNQS